MGQPQSVTEAFLPLVPEIPETDIPMFIAVLERIAASNYRGWAEASSDPIEKAGLAEFIESIYPDPNATIASIHEKFPDLKERYAEVLAGKPRLEQFRIQSEAELGGADFMGQFAAANTGAVAARFTSLSFCEEANSKYLAALVESAADAVA